MKPRPPARTLSRQALLTTAVTSLVSLAIRTPLSATAPSIKARLDARDSKLLLKPTNAGISPPAEVAFPEWLEGEWTGALSFAGYELPAKDVLQREALFAEADVPGFKKCSIAFLPDVCAAA